MENCEWRGEKMLKSFKKTLYIGGGGNFFIIFVAAEIACGKVGMNAKV